MKKRITYNDITIERYHWGLLLSCITNDGEYIKMKYLGYNKTFAKKHFYHGVNGGAIK